MKMYQFLKTIKGLENIEIDFMAEETGIRETNRVVGEHIITEDEYLNGYFYDDSVCYACYPVDQHVMSGLNQKFHEEGVVSKIPYRALVPKGSRKVFCVGRCISSDTMANSAVRVEATCMATGQVAGCAAAIACKDFVEVMNVDYKKLKSKLINIGAIVPEKN